ncbi:MAG TPA: phosphoglucomutase/phosphomannomutase family protein [Myxococcota bacterium]|jgi:phosphomannomutase|nr:phosphoglucomutase/phosphomannomutase family protein [Myxococcota bacterium]
MAAEASSPRAIRFGSGGWRGPLAEEITLPRVRVAVRAIAAFLEESGAEGPVLVAHDRRFLGPRLAAEAEAVLRAAGRRVLLVEGTTATPVVAWSAPRRRVALALVFTASHNPPEDHGLKLHGPDGASLSADATRRIEALAAEALASPSEDPLAARSAPAGRAVDLRTRYLEALGRELDRRALARGRMSVVYDALHGAGAGCLDAVLRHAGVRVTTLHGEADPTFGGVAPDPTPERLVALRAAVRRAGRSALGLATDGDGDRLAAVDGDGRVLGEHELLALLVDHAAATGRIRRGVALSIASGSFVSRVAALHGLSASSRPMGFRQLAAEIDAGRADAAGDESGGFCLARFSRDKDGLLAGCLLAEQVALSRRPLRARLRELERAVGPSPWKRFSVPATASCVAALEALHTAPPERLAGAAVREADHESGLRLRFDDGFVLVRASSTEPRIRLYVEAGSEARVERRARAMLRRIGARSG